MAKDNTCAHCGRFMPMFEAGVGDTPLCHPDVGLDCYRLVTVYGHAMPCPTVEYGHDEPDLRGWSSVESMTPFERAEHIATQLKKEIGPPPTGLVGILDDGESITMSTEAAALLLAKIDSLSEMARVLGAELRALR